MPQIRLTVNGQERTLDTPGDRALLDVIREDLNLTGAKYGCGEGQCRACTVMARWKADRLVRHTRSIRGREEDPHD